MMNRVGLGRDIDHNQFFKLVRILHSKVHCCFPAHGMTDHGYILQSMILHKLMHVVGKKPVVKIIAVGTLTVVALVDQIDLMGGSKGFGYGMPIIG